MSDYISREHLLREAKEIGGHLYSDWETAGVLSLIRKQPAADVRPVVRGTWVFFDYDIGSYRHTGEACSLCEFETSQITGKEYNFCPNCGADMRPEGGQSNGC